ncbi:MAG: GTPase Era [Oscillospiraceae bacterium]
MNTQDTKSAFVAIIGVPNVGKSSLLNAFVGEKVAIVSKKPQTTRNRITGILTRGDTQLVFIDTPGMHKPRTRLSQYMVRQVQEGMSGVDVTLLLTEPAGAITPVEEELLATLKARKSKAILVLNKLDTLRQKDLMMPKIQAFSQRYDFDAVFPISALTGERVGELLDVVGGYAKPGPHFFDPDSFTDQPERVLVAEIIREKLLNNLRDELPHGTAVGIESMKERAENEDKDGNSREIMDIEAIIFCERASHKGMIIGKKGAMLKKIATEAREEIEGFLDIKVNLQCWVKVKEDWRNREGIMRQFGFQ